MIIRIGYHLENHNNYTGSIPGVQNKYLKLVGDLLEVVTLLQIVNDSPFETVSTKFFPTKLDFFSHTILK